MNTVFPKFLTVARWPDVGPICLRALKSTSRHGVHRDSPTLTLQDKSFYDSSLAFMKARHELRSYTPLMIDRKRRAELATAIANLDNQDLWEAALSHTEPNGKRPEEWLGWTTDASSAVDNLDTTRETISSLVDNTDVVVAIGTGGSRLATEWFTGKNDKVITVDSFDPVTLQNLMDRLDTIEVSRIKFTCASKSNSNADVRLIEEILRGYVTRREGTPAEQFILITDPDKARTDQANSYLHIFDENNNPASGGRYSISLDFHTVPQELAGIDTSTDLEMGKRTQNLYQQAFKTGDPDIIGGLPAVEIANALGYMFESGRNKMTVVNPPELGDFGAWTTQLLNESICKFSGAPIVVNNEILPLNDSTYGADKVVFQVKLGGETGLTVDNQFTTPEGVVLNTPVITLTIPDASHRAELAHHMMYATALLGLELGVNPFTQDPVEKYKVELKACLKMLAEGRPFSEVEMAGLEGTSTINLNTLAVGSGKVLKSPALVNTCGDSTGTTLEDSLAELFSSLNPGDALSLQFGTYESADFNAMLNRVRSYASTRLPNNPTVMIGMEPRSHHSDGVAMVGNDRIATGIFTFDPPEDSDITIDNSMLSSITGNESAAGVSTTCSQLTQIMAASLFKTINNKGHRAIKTHLPASYRSNPSWLEQTFMRAVDIAARKNPVTLDIFESQLEGQQPFPHDQ